MNISVTQYSSLDKIFKENKRKTTITDNLTALKGERVSYQLEIICDESMSADIEIESELKEYIKIYREGFVNCDMPTHMSRDKNAVDDDYLVFEPALIPDVLYDIENNKIRLSENGYLLWVRIDIPTDHKTGRYEVKFNVLYNGKICKSHSTYIEVIDAVLPKNDIRYTEWFHTDCIASYYNVPIYSDKHWDLIDKFLETAADVGINMILTPVHNPPLDTAPDRQRPNVQLVKIHKKCDIYSFDFSRLEKWVEICKKYGFKYYEIPHFFSQWGSTSAPNIYVDNELEFSCKIPCDSIEYKNFLRQYIPVLVAKLEELDIYDSSYFHISDEPALEHMPEYKKCCEMVEEFSGGLKCIDALSNIEFYKTGLVKIPVPASNEFEAFLKEDIKERWIYYCCGQGNKVSNRFIAMSSYRNRIIGTQIYKFGIEGFLQWGYNFYYAEKSEYEINPYVTTSADYAFPSGDAFSVYPGKNKALPSIRAFVFYEALQDVALLKLLEKKTNRQFVLDLIDSVAEKDVRMADYPDNEKYIFKLREKIINIINQKKKFAIAADL